MRIQVHGHRGARARRPENTVPAFRYAIAVGVDAVELDVAVTADDVVVVSHDPVVAQIPIRSLSLDEVRAFDVGARKNPAFPDQTPAPGTPIPTLDEVFALGAGNGVRFNVEVKIFPDRPELTPGPEEFTALILECARRHAVESRMMLQCFDPRPLWAVTAAAPEMPRGALFETERDWMEVANEFGATMLCPQYRLVTKSRVERAHDAGFGVAVWTANTPEIWAELTAAGVDVVISDDPAALIRWLE